MKDAQIDYIIQDHLCKVYERRDDLLNPRRQDKLELVRHLRCLLSVVKDITPDPALQYFSLLVLFTKEKHQLSSNCPKWSTDHVNPCKSMYFYV